MESHGKSKQGIDALPAQDRSFMAFGNQRNSSAGIVAETRLVPSIEVQTKASANHFVGFYNIS
jgi:hypothetical protein